jgi:hypothetical protein
MELQILAWDRNNNVSVLNRLMEYSSDHLISSDNTSTYIKKYDLRGVAFTKYNDIEKSHIS